jgi:predicted RNase H-like nuclease
VIASETYAEAIRRCGSGPRISRQSYGLRAKVLEVDAYRYDGRLYEVHPELSFATMTGRPLPSKLTWDGVVMRRRALANQGIQLPDDIGSAGRVPVADVLDAAAAAWSAARIGSGLALCLPPAPPVQDGRLVAIWV